MRIQLDGLLWGADILIYVGSISMVFIYDNAGNMLAFRYNRDEHYYAKSLQGDIITIPKRGATIEAYSMLTFKFLFRVSPIEQYERKKSEYELMNQLAALGVPMCRPLEFGTSDEGVYSVQTWIDGVDAEENAYRLTSDEQYTYGFEAGRILKDIHKIPAPEEIEDCEIYFNSRGSCRRCCRS